MLKYEEMDDQQKQHLNKIKEWCDDVSQTFVDSAPGWCTCSWSPDRGWVLYIEELGEKPGLDYTRQFDLTTHSMVMGVARILVGDLDDDESEPIKMRDDWRTIIEDSYCRYDAGDMDVLLADCVVQAAVFGELVYG